MTENINRASVLASLRKAVESKGENYVYDKPGGQCIYVHNGAPSCLVGHVIADLFPDKLEAVAEWDYRNEGDTDFNSLQENFQFPLTYEARQLLRHVQGRQDRGDPWGLAVDLSAGDF